MLRSTLSYLILILIPAVSLAIAVVPYVILRKKVRMRERGNEIASLQTSRNDIQWKHLWLAFGMGLAGNVLWWWIFDSLMNERIAIYLSGANDGGIMFSFFLYSFFLLLTPFLFFKFKYGRFTKQRILYTVVLTIIAIAVVAGVWVLLAAIALRGIVGRLN